MAEERTIRLGGDDALVVYDYLSRWFDMNDPVFVDEAEPTALRRLLRLLEEAERGTITAHDYEMQIASARERVRDSRVRVRLVGYWCDGSEGEPEAGWPDPRDWIDETWDRAERELVASYLERGYVPWVQAGISFCRLCGKANGCAEYTDGVYLWPEGLAHYVREHSVKLPDELVGHIRQHFDAESQEPLDHLDWDATTVVDGRWWKQLTDA